MAKGRKQQRNLDLFVDEQEAIDKPAHLWPDQDRYPLNIGSHQVGNYVQDDLGASLSPLLITGYTSLDRLLNFCTEACRDNSETQPRLLIGQEPFPSKKETYSVSDYTLIQETEQYWLARNISLVYSAQVIEMVDLLKSGRVQARYLKGHRRLHAKIYVGDKAATLGSSNFTEPGMKSQHEANARFENKGADKRYKELATIAENYWEMGESYQEQLIALLEKLLKLVTWEEALARACAELLEGEWAEEYIKSDYLPGAGKLWPSQKQGIAQALTILSTQGNVLVADATGAGKTRMGIYLIGALKDHIVRSARMRKGKAMMVCPPTIEESWKRESNHSQVDLDTYSHGIFSHEKARSHDDTLEALRRAQILCIDEGHNFLNLKSQRTQRILRNMADHVLLFTATPINKSAHDLLRMADMLGADNLSESVVKAFNKMLGVRNLNRQLTEQELDVLKQEIRRFTVRRTKKQLNKLIDREPALYTDVNGKECRFPKHKAKIYEMKESDSDNAIASKIKKLTEKLHGVTHFIKPLKMPDILVKQGLSESKYLKGRLISANKLARYIITFSLRSSRAALMEHIRGTKEAMKFSDLDSFNKGQDSRGMLTQIKNAKNSGPPKNELKVKLPKWLSDKKAHADACASDFSIYTKISDLLESMSPAREREKAKQCAILHNSHKLILAFDSRPITLAVMAKILSEDYSIKVLVAWGSASSDREKVIKSFAFGSEEKGIIGLCSDSLAEAVNLQQASCLLHLDMPSVVRVAEQRVGRIDRMDSPHKAIEIWWPQDSEEFALAADERFIERYETVDKLLGSNMPLPEAMLKSKEKPVSTKQMIKESEEEEVLWDGIDDAFSSVRALIEGEDALVKESIYAHYSKVAATVLSRVSLVKAKVPWALFCVTTGSFGSPIWVFIPSFKEGPLTDLNSIVPQLRNFLGSEVESVHLDNNSSNVLQRFLDSLLASERKLLSRKKQRALEEMEYMLSWLQTKAKNEASQTHLKKLEYMFTRPLNKEQPDWDEVAAKWLDVIRPVWFERLSAKRVKPLLLKDIRKDLQKIPDKLIEDLQLHFQHFPVLPALDKRIKACIVGIA